MKKVRVEFKYIESDGSVRESEMFVPLSLSRSDVGEEVLTQDGKVTGVNHVRTGPWVSPSQPFVGELDEGEIARLTSLRGPHLHWQFSITEVK